MRGSAKTSGRGPLRCTAPRLMTAPRRATRARPLSTPQAFSLDQQPTTRKAQATLPARKTILCGCHHRRATHLTKVARTKTTSLDPVALLYIVKLLRCPPWTFPPSTRLAKWRIEMQGHMPLQENFHHTAVLSQRLWPIMSRRENQHPHPLRCTTGVRCLHKTTTDRATTAVQCPWV